MPGTFGPTIVVLGARGFAGSRAAESARRLPGWTVRPVTRELADVRDASAIGVALAGASAVVHAASHVGNDVELCRQVNVEGTANVVAAATANGARVVYLSTAAVSGRGPFRRLDEADAPLAPASTLSASRAAAERIVLDAGGLVVRPHLVLGAGDRWVGPGVAALTAAAGGLVDGGAAVHSVIEAGTLGALLVELATGPRPAHSVFHAAHREPVPVRALVAALWPERPAPPSVPLARARATVAGSPGLERALALLAVDHDFAVERVLAAASAPLDRPFALPADAIEWYQRS
ncbi:NAD-dependent epimerase/dehydratase family protein [Agromyces sp. NPDC060279]|uniref:NAD-dependent epimerase/dehydratase family protein n=1 Tax=Agromyces sp. NPDC060279 TaxID=3347092 RepID=UPI00364D9401